MKEVDQRVEKLNEITVEILNLKSSPLYGDREEHKYLPVIGEGNHFAEVVFIGEAPGKSEAKTGKPFCGASGKFLDELLNSVGVSREEVYITNIVKDRPPENRDPLPEEIEVYGPFLDRQLEIIKPKMIVTLGRFSMGYIMDRFGLGDRLLPISQMHGQIIDLENNFGSVKFLPLYHPAAAIYNQNLKKTLFEDFKKIKSAL